MDLKLLEYPRHVHGPERAYLRVNSSAEAELALSNGWSLEIVPDEVPVLLEDPLKVEDPLKRGPGRPRKIL